MDFTICTWKYFFIVFLSAAVTVLSRNNAKDDARNGGDLSLWIDEKQVKMFSGEPNLNQLKTKSNLLTCRNVHGDLCNRKRKRPTLYSRTEF